MRKKFLSAFLLGALAIATTSTMVSCKDYDDDINSLKSQIKSLEDLVAQKEATINSSIANLNSLIEKANNDHATKAALESAKKELEDAIKANYNSLVEQDTKLSAAISAAQTKADAAYSLASENKDAIGNLVNDLARANEKLGTLSEGLKEANEEIARLKAALEAQKEELEDAIKDAKSELTEADKETLKQAQAEIKALEDKLTAADKELDAKITEEIDKVNETIKGVEVSVDELQIAHNEVAAEVKTLVNTTIPAVRVEIQGVASKVASVDSKYDVITKILATSLRSLVYIPNLYVDGIETIEYAFIKDTTLIEKTDIRIPRQRVDLGETYKKELSNITDYVYKEGVSKEFVYGPAWPVKYHMNPANSKTTWDKVVGWNCREVEVATRAAVKDLGAITSPEKYDNGEDLFLNKDGILTVGLKIEKPKPLLANGPVAWATGETGNKSYGMDNIVSLKVKSEAADNATDTIITSDYAMLFPEVVHPEAIVWTDDNHRRELGNADENVSHSYASAAEVKCPLADKKFHIWDSPEEALTHTDGPTESCGQPDILLPYNSKEGVTLGDMIGTHIIKYCDIKNHTKFGVWKFKEERLWGLKYIFDTVDYLVDTNKTSDSKYCTVDSESGQIIARDVDVNGETIGDRPAENNNNSVVGREPLIRIRLVSAEDTTKVFLDGYVLVRITKAEKELVDVINDYPVEKHTFNLCDAVSFEWTTWAEFDNYVLDHLNLTKEQFDAQYKLDVKPDAPISAVGGGYWYRANVYEQIITEKDNKKDTTYVRSTIPCKGDGKLVDFTSIDYLMNEVGTTNHTFRWSITEDELEQLTHDTDLPVNLKRYVRYVGRNGAKYKYIYIKFEANLDRARDPETGIKDKIQQYWFALDGDAAGWDAVALNIMYPNGTSGTPYVWNNELISTFTTANTITDGVVNTVTFTDETLNDRNRGYLERDKEYRKFFFAPINTTIKDSCLCNDPENKVDEWTITAKSSKDDEKWNAFVCHYNICCDSDHGDIEHTPIVEHNVNKYTEGSVTKFNTEYRNYDDHSANLHGKEKYTRHKFQVTAEGKSDDAKNSAILQSCAIDYRDGCFENDILYATKDGENYTPIVKLDQATGRLTLIRPNKQNPQDASRYDYVPESVLDKVLNAVGYWGDRHQNISDELHTWVGVVVNNGCGVARDLFTVHGDNNNNYSIFEASWQRPINLDQKDPEPIEDAKNNGEIIPVYKHLKFFDWRGREEGSMEGLYKWLWGYYNIHRIAFDLNPDKVLTNMHQSSPEKFVVLSQVSKDVHLYAYKSWNYVTGTGKQSDQGLYKFDNSFDLRDFANQALNADLIAYLNLNLDKFGYIFYENNGQNVNTFSVKVPISIYYEWGHFDTYMTIEIKSTKGNQNGI